MTLVLELEYLSGVSFAAVGPDSPVADWPPQPDRIFSALVATWAARGQDPAEGHALEWLESLPPPRVLASEAAPRTAPVVFVPPNDPRSDKQKSAADVLPSLRSRQPRRFPATRPEHPVVRFLWADARPEAATLAALQSLAVDTSYVGHSASLTRCRFLCTSDAIEPNDGRVPERRVYSGRLAELCRAFDARRRPNPGALVVQRETKKEEAAGVFGSRWLLLEHVSGSMPDIRASALVAKTIRDALLSGYERIGLADRIPEIVSGHAPDGAPSKAPHMAIVPLPFTGVPYADGHVMGFAIVPPRGHSILDDQEFRSVLRALSPLDEQFGRRILMVKPREGTPAARAFALALSPTFEPPAGRRSLEPGLYLGPAQRFATVTPIVLDRYLKTKGKARDEEIAAQVAAACRRVGLPEPQAIVADNHSAFEGAPSAYPSGRAPDWMRWRLPRALADRQLIHAVVVFSEPVAGPVILGAGRFVGLGLCRPLEAEVR